MKIVQGNFIYRQEKGPYWYESDDCSILVRKEDICCQVYHASGHSFGAVIDDPTEVILLVIMEFDAGGTFMMMPWLFEDKKPSLTLTDGKLLIRHRVNGVVHEGEWLPLNPFTGGHPI